MSESELGSATESNTEPPKYDAPYWLQELIVAEDELKSFWSAARKVIRRYMDQNDTSVQALASKVDRFNVFWSNVGVLKASLYANPPKPLVKRDFDDYMDDEARVAGVMMERLLNQGFETPESDMNVAFRHTVEDRLVPGMGQLWFRYCPEIEIQEFSSEFGPPIQVEQLVNEVVATDYLYWEDYWFSPARTEAEVRWKARRVWMDREEFTGRFPKCSPSHVTWVKRTPQKQGERVTPKDMGIQKTEIFEIWCKTTKHVYWVSRSYEDKLLDECADPLGIESFFPCPPPLIGTHTTSNLVPRSDYAMTQTQYRRLDVLAMRIGMLEQAIQASGVYDKSNSELSQLLPGDGSNKMIPVDSWALFAEKGGLKGAVDWFPLETIANALDKLRQLFQDAKLELYELTGISDIMRGATAPRETATAQTLKAQYSSVRLQYLQNEVAQFFQNALRIKADIIANNFQPETIIKNSLIEYTPDGELAVPAAELIKSEWNRCYRITVHADQLAIPDYNAERGARIEFISAMGQFVSQVWPMLEQNPSSGIFFLQVLQWGIASFRSAATIEGVFDKAILAITHQIQQPAPPPPPDPALIKAQAEVGAKKQTAMIEAQEAQQELVLRGKEHQQEMAAHAQKTNAEVASIFAKTKATIQSQKAISAAKIAETKRQNRVKMRAKSDG